MVKKRVKVKDDKSSWAVPGLFFVGIGIGLLIGDIVAFTLIGLGMGFLVSYFFRHNGKKRKAH